MDKFGQPGMDDPEWMAPDRQFWRDGLGQTATNEQSKTDGPRQMVLYSQLWTDKPGRTAPDRQPKADGQRWKAQERQPPEVTMVSYK